MSSKGPRRTKAAIAQVQQTLKLIDAYFWHRNDVLISRRIDVYFLTPKELPIYVTLSYFSDIKCRHFLTQKDAKVSKGVLFYVTLTLLSYIERISYFDVIVMSFSDIEIPSYFDVTGAFSDTDMSYFKSHWRIFLTPKCRPMHTSYLRFF